MSETVTVTLDTVEGAMASRDIESGWRMTRVAIVEGLNSDSTKTTGKLVSDAIDAVIEIVGDRGSMAEDLQYMGEGAGYITPVIVAFEPEILGPTIVRVRIVYVAYPRMHWDLSPSLYQVQTNIDRNGSTIVLNYTYPSAYKERPELAGTAADAQSGLVSNDLPQLTLTIHFTVVSVVDGGQLIQVSDIEPTGSALEQAAVYGSMLGHLNNADYEIAGITAPRRTVRCTAFSAHTRDGGLTMQCMMAFTYRPAGWDEPVTFIDPRTGRPPGDLIEGTGRKTPEVLDEDSLPVFNLSNSAAYN